MLGVSFPGIRDARKLRTSRRRVVAIRCCVVVKCARVARIRQRGRPRRFGLANLIASRSGAQVGTAFALVPAGGTLM